MNPAVPLEREQNFVIIGGVDFHGVKKIEAECCLFQKKNVFRQNKTNGGNK
jgi:hypothetical protein